jgi:hypothetical protein
MIKAPSSSPEIKVVHYRYRTPHGQPLYQPKKPVFLTLKTTSQNRRRSPQKSQPIDPLSPRRGEADAVALDVPD